MVRTLRSIQEEARVRQVRIDRTDIVLPDESLRNFLEGETLQKMLLWAQDGTRRALVVGLEDEGHIVLQLASAGLFVTMVDPDEKAHVRVMNAAQEAKCAIRINSCVSEYMTREFTSSGFDVAIFFSALSRYNEPLVVLKKAVRELRAGGRLFARIRVRPAAEPLPEHLKKIPLWDRAANHFERHFPRIASYLGQPDAYGFLDEVASILHIYSSSHDHLIAPDLASFSKTLPSWGRKSCSMLLPYVQRLDSLALKIPQMTRFASYLSFYAAKELGFGKTFSINNR